MKWGRSNEMKESFNCITHPHATSCGKLFRSSAGMDIVMNRRENNAPADDGLLNGSHGFICSLLPLRSYKHPQNTYLTHKHARKVFFHTSNKPGYQKTINVALSSAILQKLPSLWWEFRCQLHTQRQSRAQILTHAILYLWHQKTRQNLKCHLVTFWRS